jgi:hypothetical protein
MANNDYRRAELSNVDATGEYPAKLKIASDDGDTKWLDITATEFEQIKAVLLDYRNDCAHEQTLDDLSVSFESGAEQKCSKCGESVTRW